MNVRRQGRISLCSECGRFISVRRNNTLALHLENFTSQKFCKGSNAKREPLKT